MISRAHGLVVSVLLGAASAVGAYAVVATAHLGDEQTKPEVMTSRQIAQRARKLDAWEVSLKKTLKAMPPALPALNRYAAVTFVAAPGAASLPPPVSASSRAGQQAKTAARPSAQRTAKAPPKRADTAVAPIRDDDEPEKAGSVAAPAPGHGDAAPAPSPAPVVVAAAPAPTPAPATSPTTTLSVEQQCRQLLRAAEGKSEQVKQEAERQCEALKQAAEG